MSETTIEVPASKFFHDYFAANQSQLRVRDDDGVYGFTRAPFKYKVRFRDASRAVEWKLRYSDEMADTYVYFEHRAPFTLTLYSTAQVPDDE